MADIRVGISGWTFEPWRGSFYPDKLPQKSELHFASRALTAIEINGTFYSMQKPAVFQKWYDEAPDGFCYAIKAPKYITHVRRLKDIAEPVANFLASGLLCLKEKLGPILWQLPPTLAFDEGIVEEFLKMLPHTFKDAAKISKKHSDWLKGKSYTKADGHWPVRHAIEARHQSFYSKSFVDLLRKYHAAVVTGDTEDGRWPYMEDLTSDFVYLRLHADVSKYPLGYSNKALAAWHKRILEWSKGEEPKDAKVFERYTGKKIERSVYCFFDNEEKITAPKNAIELISLLKKDDQHP